MNLSESHDTSYKMKSATILTLLLISVTQTLATAFTCTSRGRFKDETDLECKRYFLCSQKKNGNWVVTAYNCPDTANFDSSLGYCTSTALCVTASTTTLPTTIQTTTTESPPFTIPSNTNYTCQSEGRFPDTEACDCGWFYDCKLLQTEWHSTRLYCPPKTKFDPALSACSANYSCLEEFACTEKGSFLDPLNPDNTTYYFCEEMEDGSFWQVHYHCPAEMIFNDTLGRCVERETMTTIIETTTTELSSTTTEINLITSTSAPNTTSKYNCTESGRFSDPDDQICKWYYLCINQQAFHYNCPEDLYFDPKYQECVDDYKCPLASTTEKWISAFSCKKRGYFKNSDDSTSKSYHFCDVLADGKIYQYELMCPVEYAFDENTNLCRQ